MRLHRLEIHAFGPFADTAVVDLDALSEAGLFLMAGPTGSGKSSVLDAICFALYGQVPGDRAAARHLRSDAAAPEVEPRVVLEFTITAGRARRFRVTRSPAWERPKRRGDGMTVQQASVLVEEQDGERWQVVSQRIDEAGQLLSRLVGLTLSQFCQVVLLPQGEFQRFLRAKPEERQRLLQSIFRTRRYADIERWLTQHRGEQRSVSLNAQRVLSNLASHFSEAAGDTMPELRWDQPAGDPQLPELAAWANRRLTDADQDAVTAHDALPDLIAAQQAAEQSLRDAEELAALRVRSAAAAGEVERLNAAEAEINADGERLARAERAAPAATLLHAYAEVDADLTSARNRWRTAIAALGPLANDAVGTLALPEQSGLDPAVEDALADAGLAEAALDELATRRNRVASAADAERELAATARGRDERAAHLADQDAELTERRAEAERLPGLVLAARDALGRSTAAAQALPAVTEDLQRARAGHAAALRVAELTPALAQIRTEADEARFTHLAAKERWLEAYELRLSGMAAELASDLVVGGACPVCGSCDHPQPAAPDHFSPDAEQVKALRRRVDDTDVVVQACEDQRRTTEEQLARAQAVAGDDDVEQWRARADRAEAVVVEQRDLAAGVEQHRRTLAEREERERSLAATITALTAQQARLQAEHEAAQEHDAEVRARRDALLRTEGAGSVEEAHRALEAATARWRAVRDSARTQQTAQDAARTAHARARRAALEAGFEDLDQAAAALLDPQQDRALRERVREHEDALLAARTVLSEPAVVAAQSGAEPDPAGARRERDAAARAVQEARSRTSVADARAERLRHLHGDLTAALDDFAPLAEAFDTADRIATLASGRSAENPTSLSLSAYVVSWRLHQVIGAANERLAPMTAARYTLEQRGTGLQLDVRDEWSGELRDPATLSGGETFLVSLSLALGLADVVTGESAADADGGDLETLFVDEGFGTLDADTLDDVMDTLDSLRDGGRVVGVVSHVAELRTRIPTRLQVTPGRTGSQVSIEHASA